MASMPLVTEQADESAPLTGDEQETYDLLTQHIGERGLKQLRHEALVRYVRGYAFEARTGGKAKWQEVVCSEADKTIAWREEVDANHLLVAPLPKWDVFQASWPTGVFGTDSQGHPIVVERIQDFNLERLLSEFKPEDLSIYQAKTLEVVQLRKAKVSEKLGRLIYKHIYIIDCAGIGMNVLKSKAHIQAIFHVAQFHYPETLHRVFILHAPLVFRMIWAATSPLIHPITREKVKVYAGKGLKEMKELGIDPSQLPPSVGGTFQPDKEFEADIATAIAQLGGPWSPKLDASTDLQKKADRKDSTH